MTVDLSVKKVDDALAQRLRERAARNRRSLQQELVAILESAAGGPDTGAAETGASVGPERRAPYQVAARRLIPARSESALIIRRMRDGRNFTARDLYEYVTSLGGPAPDEAEELIRRSRASR